MDSTIHQILQRAEDLYEQFGTPLLGVSRHRRAWAFARAFGATRLAHEFGVSRATVVTARRRAFDRWQYWMTRYEEPVWQVLLRLAGAPHDWEGCMVHYLRLRARLRHQQLPAAHDEGQRDALTACAMRSLASVPWYHHDRHCWQTVWRLLARRQVRRAHAVATTLGWSAGHWRRSRRVVTRLRALVWLPLSQRQLLALSTWPLAHLVALQDTGQALFPKHCYGVLQLAQLSPQHIASVGIIPVERCEVTSPAACPAHVIRSAVSHGESEEAAHE
jgi:hypothetical protein